MSNWANKWRQRSDDIFLQADDHRWLFANQSIGDNYWKKQKRDIMYPKYVFLAKQIIKNLKIKKIFWRRGWMKAKKYLRLLKKSKLLFFVRFCCFLFNFRNSNLPWILISYKRNFIIVLLFDENLLFYVPTWPTASSRS